jgi:hypothetical protein
MASLVETVGLGAYQDKIQWQCPFRSLVVYLLAFPCIRQFKFPYADALELDLELGCRDWDKYCGFFWYL